VPEYKERPIRQLDICTSGNDKTMLIIVEMDGTLRRYDLGYEQIKYVGAQALMRVKDLAD
jgi:hypothetical protein